MAKTKEQSQVDIYRNSCIHWVDTKYQDGQEINTYLIDRRFITDTEEIINYFKCKGYNISDYQDDYFLIIKSINQYFDKNIIHEELMLNELIISLYDFILAF